MGKMNAWIAVEESGRYDYPTKHKWESAPNTRTIRNIEHFSKCRVMSRNVKRLTRAVLEIRIYFLPTSHAPPLLGREDEFAFFVVESDTSRKEEASWN